MSPRPESSRENAFRNNLANRIPRFPNNKQTLDLLKSMALGELLIHYTNWVIRYVHPRVRAVQIEQNALSDARWPALAPQISAFLDKVRRGEDLTPYLSIDPHTRGYTPPSSTTTRWEDKDFVLIVMGYHHFHLGDKVSAKGFMERTDELLFAKVTKEKFIVVGIFDHTAFESQQTTESQMTAERTRLWKTFDAHSSHEVLLGAVYITAPITTSGHSLQLVRVADEYARVVRETDPKLDDNEFVDDIYQRSGLPKPIKPKLKWHMNLMNLGLVDSSGNCFLLKYGPGT